MVKSSEKFSLLSSAISVFLFIYFAVVSIRMNLYDVFGMGVSALAIFIALVAQYMSLKERGLI